MSSITIERADQDSIRIAQQFVNAYRSGAQGASMDCDVAMALALSIDDVLTELRSLRTQTAGEAVAWLMELEGCEPIVTRECSRADFGKTQGWVVTPLVTHSKPIEVVVRVKNLVWTPDATTILTTGDDIHYTIEQGEKHFRLYADKYGRYIGAFDTLDAAKAAAQADFDASIKSALTLTDGVEVTDLTLDAEELDTILAVGRNEQSGRITNYELKELVRVYNAALTASLSLRSNPMADLDMNALEAATAKLRSGCYRFDPDASNLDEWLTAQAVSIVSAYLTAARVLTLEAERDGMEEENG